MVRGWRLRFASKVLYETPGLQGQELAEALVEAKEAGQEQEGGGGGGGAEGPETEHDIILAALLTRDVAPLLQAINAFCQGDRQGHDV